MTATREAASVDAHAGNRVLSDAGDGTQPCPTGSALTAPVVPPPHGPATPTPDAGDGPTATDGSAVLPTTPALRRRRGPQQPVTEASYLTAQDVRHYRPLMRYFYQQHQGQRFFLRVDETHRHVQQAYDGAYTEVQCQADLEQLATWGNLTRHYERARVHTIDEFLRRQAVYQITPEGVLLERFVSSLEEAGGRAGSLDKTVLDALLQRMRELDRLLRDDATCRALGLASDAAAGPAPGPTADQALSLSPAAAATRNTSLRPVNPGAGSPEGPTVPTATVSGGAGGAHGADGAEHPDTRVTPVPTRTPGPSPLPAPTDGPPAEERIATLWAEVSHHFARIAHDGVGYLGQLRGVQAQHILEHSAFHAYKDVLVRYLSSYALALAETGPPIASLSEAWDHGAPGKRLAHAMGTVTSRQPLPDGTHPSLNAEMARVQASITALARWFHPVHGDVQRLKRSTNDAIELVTRQAARLAELRWGTRSRQRDLEDLAILFNRCAGLPQAERLASVAFAAASPRHWKREWIPADLGRTSAWYEPAEDVLLPPIRRGSRAHADDDPVRERHAERDALVRASLAQRSEATTWLSALFAGGCLDLAEVHLADPTLRDRLLTLIGQCLASPDGCGEAPDGGRVTVLRWTTEIGRLEAPDGVCHVPRLLLAWEPGQALAAAPAAAGGHSA